MDDAQKLLVDFQVKDIWAPSGEPFIRGKVDMTFSDWRFGGSIACASAVSIDVKIASDGAATFEAVEQAMLGEALLLLGLAGAACASGAAAARQRAVEGRAAEAVRYDAKLEETPA